MLKVLYRLLFLAMVLYKRTIRPIGNLSFLISLGDGVATAGGRRFFLIITTITPALPRFFWAPKKITE